MILQKKSITALKPEDEKKIEKNSLRTPICWSYGRYNNGPGHLILNGLKDIETYAYDFKKQQLSVLKSKRPDINGVMAGSSAQGIIVIGTKPEYYWFSYHAMKWSKSKMDQVLKKSLLVPIQFSSGLCKRPKKDELV